ncbi:nucleoside triphosphate pyrophosphohydrolase [Edwardsiella tarda]|uniref:nucleoside triphosphate pyrophosphohydrolase n=1 Tax=Edwardsiella tarda TaxID=636 RepID=UPI000D512E52|nr:nucleoside triphosphate pyrophosphohydrolase [Edwardsiella tarda]UCQ12010.1 nucleoside triphosphate pyrophosphohydrolase [Edwardsiella tarda]
MTPPALQRLLTIMRTLRDPQRGCPWDLRQTFATIAPYTLEETYEVLDTIQRNDFNGLKEELGDLLFQVVFHAQMAQEQGLFDFDAVCDGICDKLERRHPHVFDADYDESAQASVARWEQRKQQERAQKAMDSLMDDIPLALPALMRADKIQRRCASVGFDWDTLGPVLDKVYEEIDEVMEEAQQAVVDQARLSEEVGDLLFATVNLARHLGCRAENVLEQANRKFERRFRAVEQAVIAGGSTLEQVSLAEMEAVWQQVKQQEKQ